MKTERKNHKAMKALIRSTVYSLQDNTVEWEPYISLVWHWTWDKNVEVYKAEIRFYKNKKSNFFQDYLLWIKYWMNKEEIKQEIDKILKKFKKII